MNFHSFHRSRPIVLSLAVTSTLASILQSTPARAQFTLSAPARSPGIAPANPLATDFAAPLSQKPTTVTQSEFAHATIEQVPLLTRLYQWRETVRGRAPQQTWSLSPSVNLRVGQQSLPSYALLSAGAAPAVSAQWGRISVGSTAPLLALNQSLREVDELVDGKAGAFHDQSQLSWISAQALQSKTIKLNLLAASGRRDQTPGHAHNKKLVAGDWMGARGSMALFSDWKLSGEWMRSQLQQGPSATAWQVALAGPVAHPWGVARLEATGKETETGFANWSVARPQSGIAQQKVALKQDLDLGDISGATSIELNRQLWLREEEWQSGDPANTTLAGSARLRWKLSPSLSLTGSHQHREAWRHLSPSATGNSDAEYSTEHRTSGERRESEAGAEWKLSSSLTVLASAGSIRSESDFQWDASDPYKPFTLQNEDRLALGLRHRTRRGAWQLQVSQSALYPLDESAAAQSGALRVEAERQLLPWLRLKGRLQRNETWQANSLDEIEEWRRQAEAELALSELGRLTLRYGDVRHDGATTASDGHEYGVRYQIGQGAGLSLSMEYSRRLDNLLRDDDQWRVGLTYR